MTTINGVINKVSPNSAVINGAKYISQNGLGLPRDYDKWRMSWNGNQVAPPETSSVLYLPGNPGSGTTIFDYSYNFSDSGIDTDEELDATETGVDCDADATTAIPVGAIIIVENEWMKVTATGTTLTVLRHYHGTTAATHATNQDIRVWLPNHGTITGATWERLPSGLGVLNYLTDDFTDCGAGATLGLTNAFTIEMWANPDTLAKDEFLLSKYDWLAGDNNRGYNIQKDTDGRLYGTTFANAESLISGLVAWAGTWKHMAWVKNAGIYINGVLSIAGAVNDATVSANPLLIGARQATVGSAKSFYTNGKTGVLLRIYNVNLSAGTIAQHYNSERHLFNV